MGKGKMTTCKACDKEIAKGVKKCPDCGKDQRNFFGRHKIISGILLIIVLAIIGSACGGNSSKSTSTSVDKTISIDDYKSQCNTISYDDIAREPDKYKKSKVKFTGQVIQVQESGSDIVLRINVTKGEYDNYKDTIWVNYKYSADEKKILEKDIVNLWGEVQGSKSYESVLGGQITIPEINARSIEFIKQGK